MKTEIISAISGACLVLWNELYSLRTRRGGAGYVVACLAGFALIAAALLYSILF